MKKFYLLIALAIPMYGMPAASDTIVTLENLAITAGTGGTVPLIQVSGAIAGAVQGASAVKPAADGVRTAYYWANDGAATAPTYTGSSWPVIFHGGGNLVVDPSISASVTLGATQATGLFEADGVTPIEAQPVLVDNRPIYQFCRDNQTNCFGPGAGIDAMDAGDYHTRTTGIYGTWFGVTGNGAAVIPEPSTSLLLAGGLVGFAMIRRRK